MGLHDSALAHLLAVGLVPSKPADDIRRDIRAIIDEARRCVFACAALGHVVPSALDAVASCGERLSVATVGPFVRGGTAHILDACELVRTDATHGSAAVDVPATFAAVRAAAAAISGAAVIAGFIGSSPAPAGSGRRLVTTLGRSGSDFTAALVAAALAAEECVFWKDVAGVLSADPGVVRGPPATATRAVHVPELTHAEALELCFFGAKILHANTMCAAALASPAVPLAIRCFANPAGVGTRIVPDDAPPSPRMRGWPFPVRGVSVLRGVSLLALRGLAASTLGCGGVAGRLFSALSAAPGGAVGVLMVAQSSAVRSASVVLRAEDAERGAAAVRAAFAAAATATLGQGGGEVGEVSVVEGRALVAVVGCGLETTPGVVGRVFTSVGAAQVNVEAIASGATERNIAFVVRAADADRAAIAIHDALFALPAAASPDAAAAAVAASPTELGGSWSSRQGSPVTAAASQSP